MVEELSELLSRRTEILEDIEYTFSVNKLLGWVDQFEDCSGHEEMDILANLRKITLHPKTILLQARSLKSGDYLIPDASQASILGVGEDIPRAICMDAILIGNIMAYSRMVDHGLKEDELNDIYLHHCLEIMLNTSRTYQTSDEESVKILHYYVTRIANNSL